jgi:hypothetical protein
MPTPTYTPLATTTLAGTPTSVTFSSIPATYRDLVLVIRANTASTPEGYLRLNSDTGSNYSTVWMRGNGSAAASSTSSTTYFRYSGDIALGGGVSFANGMAIINIMDYSTTNKHKTILARANRSSNGVVASAGRWASTSAVTSVTVLWEASTAFAVGDTVSLYGIIS